MPGSTAPPNVGLTRHRCSAVIMGCVPARTYREGMFDAPTHIDRNSPELWRELAQQLRVDSIRMVAAAGSGHPSSALSAADLMAVLLARYLHYDFTQPGEANNDHLIFSKGHASPLLYAMYRAAGAISEGELLTYRKLGSRLEGHPTPRLPWVDTATGSLGLGLPVGVGIALAGKRLDKLPYRVWVLTGDSELAEGSVWEAFARAGHAGLDNLIVIADVNRLGQSGETMLGWDTGAYAARLRAFGWRAIEIDGHDVEAIDRAYAEALERDGRPVVIFARTRKGKGVAAIEDRNGFHGKPLSVPEAAIGELGGRPDLILPPQPPSAFGPDWPRTSRGELVLPTWSPGELVATRAAYGEALRAIGAADERVVAMDGEVGNSTYSEIFRKAFPERYFEMYVAEQQMVASAIGLQARHWIPFASTFAAFWSRAYDFIRMAAISRADIRLVGSHTGVTVGEDGPSQMALEDIAMFRAVHRSTVLVASDANQTAALVGEMLDREGVTYLRTMRMATPVIYAPGENFPVGGSKVLRASRDDDVTLIGAGITVHEALAAADRLAEEWDMRARVIDLYSVKPIDAETVVRAARETGRIVIAEDHWDDGGVADAVLEALADAGVDAQVRRLGVTQMPTSGEPEELLRWARIDRWYIANIARELVLQTPGPVAASGGW
jgi:transketolase